MDERGFREFIREGKRVPQGLSEKTIRSHVRAVKEFEEFLSKRGKKGGLAKARQQDVRAFIRHLFRDDRLDSDKLLGLLRYSRFAGNNDAIALLLEVVNSDQLTSLHESFGKKYGSSLQKEILGGFEPPPIGTPHKRMPKATTDFMTRLESGIGEEATREFLVENCPDVSPPERHSEERDLFLASKDVDDYLRKRRRKYLKELEGYLRDGTLYYNQRIDRSVIDFVRKNPGVGIGVRRGALIYHTKIPYMAIDYLRERDPKMKRYYCCHCPLARESILSGEAISRNLCSCSAGFCKRPFEVAFGRPLKIEVTKSALWGDPVCQFAIEVPEDILQGKKT